MILKAVEIIILKERKCHVVDDEDIIAVDDDTNCYTKVTFKALLNTYTYVLQ